MVALDNDFGLIADLIHQSAQEVPNHPALMQDDRVMSYGALDAMMDRAAASLQRDGIAQRAAIAVCASTSIEYAALFLGGVARGRCRVAAGAVLHLCAA